MLEVFYTKQQVISFWGPSFEGQFVSFGQCIFFFLTIRHCLFQGIHLGAGLRDFLSRTWIGKLANRTKKSWFLVGAQKGYMLGVQCLSQVKVSSRNSSLFFSSCLSFRHDLWKRSTFDWENDFLFSPLFGEMIQFWLIFFRWVETTNQSNIHLNWFALVHREIWRWVGTSVATVGARVEESCRRGVLISVPFVWMSSMGILVRFYCFRWAAHIMSFHEMFLT